MAKERKYPEAITKKYKCNKPCGVYACLHPAIAGEIDYSEITEAQVEKLIEIGNTDFTPLGAAVKKELPAAENKAGDNK